MNPNDRVVLAYSGGVDTTACIPYLRHEMGCKFIVAMAVDLGQGEELDEIQEKALIAGADVSIIVDAKQRFVEEYGLPALKANALYDNHYPLSSALGRPLIGQLLVECAKNYRCGAVAHGCTGKGNDQVRLDLTVALLDPSLKIYAPARVWPFSRADSIAYSEKYGIEPHVTKEKPWAIDLNVLGRNVEAGSIEDLSWETTEEVWSLTQSPQQAPDEPEYISIGFHQGVPASLNGEFLAPLSLFSQLNIVAGKHGIGRVDMIENRVVGVKSRELYEVPAMQLLLLAHREIEQLTLPADLLAVKANLEAVYSKQVYDGLWFSPLKSAIDQFIHTTQATVSGEIKLKLYKGSAYIVGRSAEHSMYVHELITYGQNCTFNQNSAEGFIDLFGLPSRVWSSVNHSQKCEDKD
ncbi:argininosuccinate synthase [Vibrio ouci]|uniref:Argininosuccinate synthase n=1 Tax=Vibrio ouci TaxID=2499078 RepID=A0A4Y8WJL0_9VIBR|nr:argininosuccinate synthase [Vibrio ouci]TFH92846.1 argininosuccinate synthase [Vibrio ouci]